MRLEPRTPGLRVKHFTTEPRGTLKDVMKRINVVADAGEKKSKNKENKLKGVALRKWTRNRKQLFPL